MARGAGRPGLRAIADLQEAFDESDLPFRVDLLGCMSCPSNFTKPLRQTMRWCSKVWAAIAKLLRHFSDRRLAVNN
ncbi:hypothetical protein [Nodosilinea nodulosa]|uniref:hypothetical protein n=1 Tax=Nodosilinea nodulosa TaxID=416001 RepID=UPI0002FEEDAE|nr:hypothetical protein [Nodosilinea nodulosa]